MNATDQLPASAATEQPSGRARSLLNLQKGRPFQPGQSGNPKGRVLGSRQVITERFVRALARDFTAHGRSVIAAVRKKDPSTYLRVIAGLLPAKVDLDLNASGRQDGRTLEQVQAEIAAAIEKRAQELVDQRMTVQTVDKSVCGQVAGTEAPSAEAK